jgi:hypothetical protein
MESYRLPTCAMPYSVPFLVLDQCGHGEKIHFDFFRKKRSARGLNFGCRKLDYPARRETLKRSALVFASNYYFYINTIYIYLLY